MFASNADEPGAVLLGNNRHNLCMHLIFTHSHLERILEELNYQPGLTSNEYEKFSPLC